MRATKNKTLRAEGFTKTINGATFKPCLKITCVNSNRTFLRPQEIIKGAL